jgi:hypothetical protein
MTLIDVANALGPDAEPWNKPLLALSRSEIARGLAANIQIDARQRRSTELAQVRRWVRNLPKVVTEYIGPVKAETCQTAIDRYNEAITARDVLRGFSEMHMPLKRAGLEYRLERRSLRLVRIEFNEISKRGMKPQLILRFDLSPIVEALDGTDISRIRICKTCDKLFWAYRYNADYCRRKCGNAFRNREYRKGPQGI